MEVVKSNYEACLPLLKQAIEEADFIAFDTEFTGLYTHKNKTSPFDDLEMRYSKLKDSAKSFPVIQFGVATFCYEPPASPSEHGKFVAKPFNFYIFSDDRDDNSTESSNRVFSCQPSSILFLTDCGFDFNKLFREGIPFSTLEDEERKRVRRATNASGPGVPIDARNQEFFNKSKKLVDDWLQNPTSPVLSVPCPSSYHRRIMYQILQDPSYNGRLQGQKDTKGDMDVSRLTDEERKKILDGEELKNRGPNFSDVIKMMCDSGKPLVGHNCLLDLCHTLSQFKEALPPTLKEFKDSLRQLSQTIIDTKHIASASPEIQGVLEQSSTGLGELYSRVQQAPFSNAPDIVMHPDFTRYTSGTAVETLLHEAGYDAYCTGAIYARLGWYIIGRKNGVHVGSYTKTEEMAPYVNRLFLMRSDIRWLGLGCPDDEPLPRLNNFYISNIPVDFNNTKLHNAFPDLAPIHWRWIDDTHCWMVIRDEEKISRVPLGIVAEGDAKGILVESWEEWNMAKYGKKPALSEVVDEHGTGVIHNFLQMLSKIFA